MSPGRTPHDAAGAAAVGRRSARWVRHATARLRAAGHRRGGARREVIGLLAAEPCALTAPEIERNLRAAGRSVGRASVYRALVELAELGLVHRLDVGGEVARYERVEPDGEHHHHMVCDRCGAVLPFEDAGLERAVARVTGGAGFQVRDHEIVLRGACAVCR